MRAAWSWRRRLPSRFCAHRVATRLLEGFRNPPPEARLRCYWWWLNGNTTEAAITRDLEQMKAKGYGGALLVDANGSEQQGNRAVPRRPHVRHAGVARALPPRAERGRRLGLEISLNIESGWNLGGPTTRPEQAAKLLTWSRTAVEGPAEFRQRARRLRRARTAFIATSRCWPIRWRTARAPHAPHPPARAEIRRPGIRHVHARHHAAAGRLPAAPGEEDTQLAQVQDLTRAHDARTGNSTWQAPPATWEILRVGYTANGAKVSTSSGDVAGPRHRLPGPRALGRLLARKRGRRCWRRHALPRRSLRYLVTDSWELGGVNWTAQVPRGIPPPPRLRSAAVPARGRRPHRRRAATRSNRFLNDFRRTVADLVIERALRASSPNWRRATASASIRNPAARTARPSTRWKRSASAPSRRPNSGRRSATHRMRDDERFFVKEGSSAAHTYGKTLVAAEGMTSIGPQWEESIWRQT